jgi:hypothetical protein
MRTTVIRETLVCCDAPVENHDSMNIVLIIYFDNPQISTESFEFSNVPESY